MENRLSDEELTRYGRQLALPEFKHSEQERLKKARVVIIGLGGLGSPCAIYLAAAGVGTLGLIDSDDVVLSNLHRQILHSTTRLNRAKTESAAETLKALNPHTQLEIHTTRLNDANASSLIEAYDLVVDAGDNFPTRFLTNETCVRLGKPMIHGSVLRFEGHASVFDARKGPCYRCLCPEAPPSELVPDCADAGVIGVLPGLIGLIQATETIKLLAGIGNPLIGRLLLYDALTMRFRETALAKNPSCSTCGGVQRKTIP